MEPTSELLMFDSISETQLWELQHGEQTVGCQDKKLIFKDYYS